MLYTGHALEQRRARGDTHVGQHVGSAIHVMRCDATFAIDHDMVERKAMARGEESRLDLRRLLAKAKTDPARLNPLLDASLQRWERD